MPDNIKNSIACKNINKLDIYGTDTNGNACVDFNKIIKMPDAFNDKPSPIANRCLALYEYISRLNSNGGNFIVGKDRGLDLFFPGDDSLIEETLSYIDSFYDVYAVKHMRPSDIYAYKDSAPDSISSSYNLGKSYHDTYFKYGAITWHDWRFKYWGTDNNAFNLTFEGSDRISFMTTWAAPIEIYAKLFLMYPDKDISIKYADEESGFNAGEIVNRKGEMIHTKADNLSTYAHKIHRDVWGDDDAYSVPLF